MIDLMAEYSSIARGPVMVVVVELVDLDQSSSRRLTL